MHRKGTQQAKLAGKKAAETRARNKALKGASLCKRPKGISTAKVNFKKLEESNFHKITCETPVDIYLHKRLNSLYISPHNTVLTK